MLKAFLSVFQSLFHVIGTLLTALINTFRTVLKVLSTIPRFFQFLVNLLTHCVPSFMVPFVMVSITLGILYLVIDRRN